jgi:hypothetical protein
VKRRALLAASAAPFAGLTGCLGTARRRVSGPVEMAHATTVFHPADEPWFVGGLSATSRHTYRTDLFTESPADVDDLFTEHYPKRERSMDNDLRNDDYSNGFLLLFEAKMPVEAAFSVRPTTRYGERAWTGWDSVSLPAVRSAHDHETLSFDDDVEAVVATTLTRYETAATPSKAVVTVYDEASGRRVAERTARPRVRS